MQSACSGSARSTCPALLVRGRSQGHELAVKDICFSNDGRRFVSTSYDKQVKVRVEEHARCATGHVQQN